MKKLIAVTAFVLMCGQPSHRILAPLRRPEWRSPERRTLPSQMVRWTPPA